MIELVVPLHLIAISQPTQFPGNDSKCYFDLVFSCPEQLNRRPCLSVCLSGTTNNQSLHNTTEWPQRLVTFETFDQRDEKTWPDQKEDNDKDKDKDKDNDKDKYI